jgi:3-hydroxybutyryl-CoA dehydrogenase
MKILVIADEGLKAELLSQTVTAGEGVEWVSAVPGRTDADALIDLLFVPNIERVENLRNCGAQVVIINEVVHSLQDLPSHFVRINGWPLFLQRPVAEAAGPSALRTVTEEVMNFFQKKTEWVADQPGLVTARIVAMIINEAYFALEEGVSTREEIDIAMKLGTNYPYGPFDWFQRTGGRRFMSLLTEMARTNPRYQPSSLLIKDALAT